MNDKKIREKYNKITDLLMCEGLTITTIIHSHPGNAIPSGFEQNDKVGDRFSASLLSFSHGFPVDHYVYLPAEEYLVMFDNVQIDYKSSSSWFEWYY